MINTKPSLLYITDLYYKANNRAYYLEDIYITSELRNDFDIIICHPLHSLRFEQLADLIVIRNSGPTIYYKEYFSDFFSRVKSKKISTYNSFDGRGDICGKEYLITLTKEGYPVIPTVGDLQNIDLLPNEGRYIVKPKNGADSIGMKLMSLKELQLTNLEDDIVQPFINFEYEVSFYFIDAIFQYALYAPNKNKRWQLKNYTPSEKELLFANSFAKWNTMKHGIQRVDACKTQNGELLLVELEDLNPFLSIELLDTESKDKFINNFKASINNVINNSSFN